MTSRSGRGASGWWKPPLWWLSGPGCAGETRSMPRLFVLLLALGSLAWPAGAGATGQIGYDGCLANDASQGCADVKGTPLSGADGLAVSPDGSSLYVMGTSSDD